MAIYHCSIKIHSRGNGQDAIATAAYRSGEKLESERTGQISDYSKRGGVEFTEIILPEHVRKTHPEYYDRQKLWNAVDAAEKADNAQFSREFEVALPKELTVDQMKEVVRDFCKGLTAQGMIVDWALHRPHDIRNADTGEKETNNNWHAHINCTVRTIDKNGSWVHKQRKEYLYELDENGEPKLDKDGKKIKIPELDKNGKQKIRIRNRNGKISEEKLWKRITVESNPLNSGTKEQRMEQANAWRKQWEEAVNRGLERAGREERIDCRSLKDQGIERIPQIHVGVAAPEIERKQKQGKKIPFSYREYTESSVISGLEKLKQYLERVLPAFRKPDGVINKIGTAVYHLIEKCERSIQKARVQGVTRKDVNELIKARNRAADLIDAQIKEMQDELAELQSRAVRDAVREQDIYERLERLRSQRTAYDTARRDAERNRTADRTNSESAEGSGRKGNGDNRTAKQNQQSTESGSGLSESIEESHRRRR